MLSFKRIERLMNGGIVCSEARFSRFLKVNRIGLSDITLLQAAFPFVEASLSDPRPAPLEMGGQRGFVASPAGQMLALSPPRALPDMAK